MKQVKGIWLPDSDTHFESHLLKGEEFKGAGTYQFTKIKKCLDSIPVEERQGALDIGAHVGLWSRVLACHFTHVQAFEPVQENRECFELNMMNLPFTRLPALYPYALGERNGTITMTKKADNTGNHYVAELSEDTPAEEQVDVFRLDDLDLFKISFIKIDVEGYELNVLKGAVDTIKREKPYIIIEQKPGNAERYGIDQYAGREFLKALGMREVWSKAGDFFFAW